MSRETAVVEKKDTPLVRPLHVLVPLIKKDLDEGREASERAGMPYYQAAGEKLIEAKPQCQGGFEAWASRNFKITSRQAREYMNLARTTAGRQNGSGLPFTSLRDCIEQTRNNPNYGKSAAWHQPVREVINKVDTDTLNLRKAEMSRIEDRDAQRKLALQLIDIGYKALATKLHPDKGGSRDAMARLNQVRDRLKQHA